MQLLAQTASIQGIVKDQTEARSSRGAGGGDQPRYGPAPRGYVKRNRPLHIALYPWAATRSSDDQGDSPSKKSLRSKLDVGQTARVDFTLKPGTVTEP